jgi:hypothetical protein
MVALPGHLQRIAPYGIVALIGAVVGLAEIASTFLNYPREALRTRWGQLLILVNALAAALAFWIAWTYAPDANLPLLVIGVGVGFQALIRTRFTIAKSIGDSGSNVELNLGWLYDQFQHLCKTQIDLEFMRGRRTAVTRLLTRYPSLTELHGIAVYTITARATLTPEEQQARIKALEPLLDSKLPVDLARATVALCILENGGQAYVDLLLDQSVTGPSDTVTPESLVKRLVDTCSLEQLVDLTKRLVPASESEVHTWVEQAAKPTPDASEAERKAAIAQMLVHQAGVDVVRREVQL